MSLFAPRFTALFFFESVRCSSKSDSNGIDHVEHWIFSPHMDGVILQIQDSPTIYTNRHIQWHQTTSPKKTSTTNATHYACQNGSFWKVTWTYEAHCLPQWKNVQPLGDQWRRSKGFLKSVRKIGRWMEFGSCQQKKVFHPAVSRWRVAVKKELQCLPGGNAFPVFLWRNRFSSGSPTAQGSRITTIAWTWNC